MQEMLAKEEREAQHEVDHELDSCQQKNMQPHEEVNWEYLQYGNS